MALFKTTEEKEAARQEAERAAYAASPVGQAEQAKQDGQTFFQLVTPVSKVKGRANDGLGIGTQSTRTKRFDATDVLGQIEELGWHLEHVGYVFVETGANTRAKVTQAGEMTRTDGYVEGIYLFRSTS